MILFDDAASEPLVKTKRGYVRFEDPEVKPAARSSCRKLADGIAKQPLAHSSTTRLRANVKIVHEAAPNRIGIALAANEPLHDANRIECHVDQLC